MLHIPQNPTCPLPRWDIQQAATLHKNEDQNQSPHFFPNHHTPKTPYGQALSSVPKPNTPFVWPYFVSPKNGLTC